MAGGTGSTEVANDLTAETFAQALVSLRRFRGSTEAEAVAWLYGIAHNLLRQYRRRERVESSARKRLGMTVRDYAGYDEAEELADAQRLSPALEEAWPVCRSTSARRSTFESSAGSASTRSPSASPSPLLRPHARDARPSRVARAPGGSGMSLLPADLYALGQDLRCAAARRRRRTRRRALVAVAAVLAAATAAVAVGASTLLGGSAPRAVQIDLGTAVSSRF